MTTTTKTDFEFDKFNTMSLDGGINMYSRGRYNDAESPKGRIVRFIDCNGWDYDLEYARKYFDRGDYLIINEIYVGRSSSTVEFIGLPDKEFNTVHFVDVTWKE